MIRRNILLATHTPTDGLNFPIYLVDGDNGQLGVDLYNYMLDNSVIDSAGTKDYIFKENQQLFISGGGLNKQLIEYVSMYNNLTTFEFSWSGKSQWWDITLNLKGYLEIYYDD